MTLALFWQDGQRSVGLTSKVIRREDWAELLNSHEMLQRAQACEAASAERAACAEHEARQQGFEAGREQGREEGLREVLGQLRDEQAFVSQLHEHLVQLLTRALGNLLSTLPPEQMLRTQIQHCLSAARREQGSRLLVAGGQVPAARQFVAELLGHMPDWLEVLPAPGLHGADVVLESHGAIFDGRLSAQVQAWRQQVTEVLAPGWKEAHEH